MRKTTTIFYFLLALILGTAGGYAQTGSCLTPIDHTASLGADGTVTITPADVVSVGANCTFESMTISPDTFTCEDVGQHTVTITAGTPGGPTGQYASVGLQVWDAYSGNDILSGDINGDGYADVVSNRGWYRNNAGISFSRIDMYSYDLGGPQLGDLDGDGDLDLIAQHGVYLFNQSSGNFQFIQSINVNMSTSRVTALADFDNDGDLDWYVTTYYWGENGLERLFINDGTGHFTLGNSYAAGSYQMSCATGDFDEDGTMDVVTVGYYDVYIGFNDGTFAQGNPVNFNYTSVFTNGNDYIRDVKAEDFNNDGHVDLLFAGYAKVGADMGLIIMWGNGDGTFQPAQMIETYGTLTWDIDVNDFEGDGDMDIVTVVNGQPGRLYLNDGQGNFASSTLPFTGAYWNVMKVKLDDYNNDGIGDFAKSNEALITEWAGGQEIVTATVTVADDAAPQITAAGGNITLWPPNHHYQTVFAEDCFTGVMDNCSALNNSDVIITRVTSDEPEDANGGGDGNTDDDMVIAPDCHSVNLRKERNGSGNGRVYTLYLEIQDASGNTGTATYEVHVPKNNNGTAVNDGVAYEVTGSCATNKAAVATVSPVVTGTAIKAWPNPTSGQATIEISVTEDSHTTVEVYNSFGQQVALLYDGMLEAGSTRQLTFNGQALPKGMYFVHARGTNMNLKTEKLIIR